MAPVVRRRTKVLLVVAGLLLVGVVGLAWFLVGNDDPAADGTAAGAPGATADPAAGPGATEPTTAPAPTTAEGSFGVRRPDGRERPRDLRAAGAPGPGVPERHLRRRGRGRPRRPGGQGRGPRRLPGPHLHLLEQRRPLPACPGQPGRGRLQRPVRAEPAARATGPWPGSARRPAGPATPACSTCSTAAPGSRSGCSPPPAPPRRPPSPRPGSRPRPGRSPPASRSLAVASPGQAVDPGGEMPNLLQGGRGRPLHPMLVHFPVALYPTSLVFDALSHLSEDGNPFVVRRVLADRDRPGRLGPGRRRRVRRLPADRERHPHLAGGRAPHERPARDRAACSWPTPSCAAATWT